MSNEYMIGLNDDLVQELGQRRFVGSIGIVVSNPLRAVRLSRKLIEIPQNHCAHLHFVHAYTVALADKDSDYGEVFSGTAINFPDGKPLTWVSKIRGDAPRLQQVRGPQFFLDMFEAGQDAGLRHYLLGSTDAVLRKLKTVLIDQYPNALIVGTHSPPFRQLSERELEEQDASIRRSGADIIWVGLGTPKQDYEVQRLATSVSALPVAVGAAFDFAAGTVKVAPGWASALGLEWLFRLASEPRRLWRRYLFGNSRFIMAVLRSSTVSSVAPPKRHRSVVINDKRRIV